jgi:hypothetical protein
VKRALAIVAFVAACGGGQRATRSDDVIVLPMAGSSTPLVATIPTSPGRSAPRDKTIIRSIGSVEIGQSLEEVRKRLGPEIKRIPYDDEHRSFTSFSYDTKRVVSFIIGFDDVYVFNDTEVRSFPPIWKVYFKDERVILIKITAVGFEDYLREHRVGFPPSCFLMDAPAGIFETFGQSFHEEQVPDHVTYHFVDRGISVMVFDEAIRVFDVFGDVGDATRAQIKAAFAKPKD